MIKKILIIYIFLITSCGYKPIFVNQNQLDREFFKINLSGDSNINNEIINSLSFKENNNNDNELFLTSNYIINEISKNSKGQVTSYKSSVKVSLLIKKNNEIIKTKKFLKDFNYSNRKNKYELVNYQNIIKTNLIDEIKKEIIIFINLE